MLVKIVVTLALCLACSICLAQSPAGQTEQLPGRAEQTLLYDTSRVTDIISAGVSVLPAKEEIYTGECVTIKFSFDVMAANIVPLQFFELTEQLEGIQAKLRAEHCLTRHSKIEDIVGEHPGGDSTLTRYTIIESAYCPTTTSPIVIPEIKLKMLRRSGLDRIVTPTVILFKSKPVTVSVKSLPDAKVSTNNIFRLVGDFNLSEKVRNGKIVAGIPFTYEVTLSGKGMTFPVTPPVMKLNNGTSSLQEIMHSDTIIDKVLHSRRTFVYNILFSTHGTFSFKGAIRFTPFNPATGNSKTLESDTTIQVRKNEGVTEVLPAGNFYKHSNFIVIDVSRSMELEDYKPSRLAFVKSGVKEFFNKSGLCNVGVIAFGGNAIHLNRTEKDPCFPALEINFVDLTWVQRGTAIGDAIWMAVVSAKQTREPAKIVIICDGDNTAGSFNAINAALFAKANNTRVFTIGIGTREAVPYGNDASGKPYMLFNTFNDSDLKRIAEQTGGKYFYIRDNAQLQQTLNSIFAKP